MSELSELSGECEDCGEYNADCLCEFYAERDYEPNVRCDECEHNISHCVCDEQANSPKPKVLWSENDKSFGDEMRSISHREYEEKYLGGDTRK